MKFNIALFPVALIISGCTVQSDSTYNLALDEMTPKVIEMTLDKYQSQVVQVQSEFYLPPFKRILHTLIIVTVSLFREN